MFLQVFNLPLKKSKKKTEKKRWHWHLFMMMAEGSIQNIRFRGGDKRYEITSI